jgi:hypothetical protein
MRRDARIWAKRIQATYQGGGEVDEKESRRDNKVGINQETITGRPAPIETIIGKI